MILFLYYLRTLSNLDKTCSGMFTKMYWVILSFVQIGALEAIFCLVAQWISVCAFHIYCPIWVTFGIISNTLLLSICKLCENRHKDCHTFLTGINAVIFSRVSRTVGHFANKGGLDIKSVYLPFDVRINRSTRILQSHCGKIWTSNAVLKNLLQLLIMCCGLVAVMTWIMREPWSGEHKWGKWRKCTCAKRKFLLNFILGCLLWLVFYKFFLIT
jgi:hypothetical protein